MAEKDNNKIKLDSGNPLKNVHTSKPATENRNFQLNTQKETTKPEK